MYTGNLHLVVWWKKVKNKTRNFTFVFYSKSLTVWLVVLSRRHPTCEKHVRGVAHVLVTASVLPRSSITWCVWQTVKSVGIISRSLFSLLLSLPSPVNVYNCIIVIRFAQTNLLGRAVRWRSGCKFRCWSRWCNSSRPSLLNKIQKAPNYNGSCRDYGGGGGELASRLIRFPIVFHYSHSIWSRTEHFHWLPLRSTRPSLSLS